MSFSSTSSSSSGTSRWWWNSSLLGIVLATFFSDFSHEMCTAVLPLYLTTLQLGPSALGMIEGIADFLVSLSKLGGGVLGHYVQQKREWASLGYLLTAVATWGIALVETLAGLISLRGLAWIGRGFRGPLRDDLLAGSVPASHYGRAYGIERAADMLGAVAGPLVATGLLWMGWEFRAIILWTLVPGLLAAAAMFVLTKAPRTMPVDAAAALAPRKAARFPRRFWYFLLGVLFFGLGDFSRTFLIFLGARALGDHSGPTGDALSVSVLLYALHNLLSAGSAYSIGHLADRTSRLKILLLGYGIGVGTNLLLALFSRSIGWLFVIVVLSGIYIAIEETLEKAVAAEMLPPGLRSLGFGILACANAVGDMTSSLYVGYLLDAGRPGVAFGAAAALGLVGLIGLTLFCRRPSPPHDSTCRV